MKKVTLDVSLIDVIRIEKTKPVHPQHNKVVMGTQFNRKVLGKTDWKSGHEMEIETGYIALVNVSQGIQVPRQNTGEKGGLDLSLPTLVLHDS
ncbi:unnamed protein product [Arctia plantaginis]|uniref:Uncharacterized protein n=1 Tax=Arctia plantaginis TaxID=874455 RepID=A0A8S0Z957_ARCPL|nr:unnamed protein product [Arctia plantaginis]